MTLNWRPGIVVKDEEARQEMAQRGEEDPTVAAIKQALEVFERGEERPAREALEELRWKLGIR